MNKQFVKHVLVSAMAGLVMVYVAGCSKPVESATESTASTTVGTEIDDSVVTTRVKTALLENATIKSYDLKVETRKGEVMLSGFVDNVTQMELAASVARAIPGVKGVDNKMSLKDAPTSVGNKLDDGVITTRVKASLLADERIKSLDIAVVTRKGEVQLSGFVNNQSQIDSALAVARGVEGVTHVGNEMSIKK
jgi:hyperosmotically inducible protein